MYIAPHQGFIWCLGDASKLLFPTVERAFSAGTGANHLTGDAHSAALRFRTVVNPNIISCCMHLPRIALHLFSRFFSGCVMLGFCCLRLYHHIAAFFSFYFALFCPYK